jgi:hypothetical protein
LFSCPVNEDCEEADNGKKMKKVDYDERNVADASAEVNVNVDVTPQPALMNPPVKMFR